MPVRLGNDSIEIINPDKTYVVDTIKSTGERDGDTVLNVPVISPDYVKQSTVSQYTVLDADATNLVAWYKFDGNGNDMLLDASGNNHTLINPSGTTPEYDNVIKVVGDGSLKLTNDYIDMPSTLNPYTIWNGNGISFSLWFKMSTSSPNYARIFTFCDNNVGTNPSNLLLLCRNKTTSNLLFRIMISDSYTDYIAVGSFVDNNWHHLVWSIYTTGVWSVYIDNVYINPNTTQIPSNFTPTRIYIGRSGYPVDTTYSTLNMDDFRIYDKVLTPTEIGYLANNMIKLEPQPIPDTPDYKVLTFTYDETRYPELDADDTNLIAHYKFDGNGNDSSGNDKHLTEYNITYENTDKIIGQSSFHNGTGYFEISNDGYFSPDIFSVSCWVKAYQQASYQAIASCRDATSYIGWTIYLLNNQIYIYTGKGSSPWMQTTTYPNFASNTPVWRHLVVLWNKSTSSLQIYVNGNLESTVSITGYTNNNRTNLRIGSGKNENNTPDYYLENNSLIDDFRIYDKALTQTEITDLYNQYSQTPYTLTFDNPTECDILIVGGGGGGGVDGQGGGGGGIININKFIMTANTNYTIKVGNGGNGSYNRLENGFNGLNSQILNDNGDIIFSGNGGVGGKSKFFIRNNGGGDYTSTTLNGTNWQMKWTNDNDLSQLSFIDHVQKNIIFKVNNPSGATIQYKSSFNKTNGFRYQIPGNARTNVNSYISSWTTVNLPDQTIFGFISGGAIKYDLILFTGETAGEGGSHNITSDVSYIYESIETYNGKTGSTSLNINDGVDGEIGYNINYDNIIYGSSGYGIGYIDTTNPITINNTGIGGSSGDITREAVYPRNGGSGIVIIRYKQQYNQVPFNAQWTYSAADTSVHHYGNVGIGIIASDTTKLAIRGDVNVIGDYYKNDILLTEQWKTSSQNTNNIYREKGFVGIGTDNVDYGIHVIGQLYASYGGITGNDSTVWTSTSDSRVKQNIVPASGQKCVENVRNINLYRFNYNSSLIDTDDKHQLGFIAQEVQQYYPKAVKTNNLVLKNNMKIDNLLSVDVTQINYTLYGTVKKLAEDINTIREKLGITEIQTDVKNLAYVRKDGEDSDGLKIS